MDARVILLRDQSHVLINISIRFIQIFRCTGYLGPKPISK